MLPVVAVAVCLMLFYKTLAITELETTSVSQKKEITDQMENKEQDYARGNLLCLLGNFHQLLSGAFHFTDLHNLYGTVDTSASESIE